VVFRAMRRILVDHARARAAARRNEGQIQLDTSIEFATHAGTEPMKLLDLDLAMDALARERSSLAELIEMRYFGGMTAEETAEVVGRSVHVFRHELRLAHAWLRRELLREHRDNRPRFTPVTPKPQGVRLASRREGHRSFYWRRRLGR
jgi:RNA polymerase sigma factor (TIGR02999 family)